MKIKKIRWIIIIAVIASPFLYGLYIQINNDMKDNQIIERCESIKLGMTKEEVIQILGNPISTSFRRKGIKVEIRLGYPAYSIASSGGPTIILDSAYNSVEYVSCYDGHGLSVRK